MKFVNVAEAKAKFSEILKKSEKEDVIITNRGKPTAIIQGLREEDLEDFIITHSKKIRKQMDEAWEAYEKGDIITLKEVRNLAEKKTIPGGDSESCL